MRPKAEGEPIRSGVELGRQRWSAKSEVVGSRLPLAGRARTLGREAVVRGETGDQIDQPPEAPVTSRSRIRMLLILVGLDQATIESITAPKQPLH